MASLLPVLYLVYAVTLIESARILAVFPIPSISHQVVFRSLTHELARRGHEVVVITTDPVHPKGEILEKLTEIDVHDVSYSRLKKAEFKSFNDVIEEGLAQRQLMNEIFEAQLKTENVQKLLSHKEDHFDLILVEALVRATLGFSHVFKAPVILVSSFGGSSEVYKTIGAPSHPILYPDTFRRRIYKLTIREKIMELIFEFRLRKFSRYQKTVEDGLLKKIFGDGIPSLDNLNNNIAMLFLNIHPIWDSNRPVPPGVVYMGGLHQNPQKELPEDLKSYLDSSKNGVIYFSLGTNVKPSIVPTEKLQAIIKVFSRLPYDVLWKWDNDELPGRPDKIKLSKWLPQADLLRHPKIILFITQGGLQSTDEAITAGVPLVGIPLLGDQWYNVEKYVYHGIGVRIDIDTLNEEIFEIAVQTVINDKSYRENIVKLREIMVDQPQSPLERAVWWTEHVLRHGDARHLRCPAANISWTQYLEFELVLALTSVLIVSLFVVYLICKVIWNFLRLKVFAIVKIKKS